MIIDFCLEEEFALQSLQKSNISNRHSSIHAHSVEILGGIVQKSAVDEAGVTQNALCRTDST
jgi:hypothetical protein